MWTSGLRWLKNGDIRIRAFGVNGQLTGNAAASLERNISKLTEGVLFVIIELPHILNIDEESIAVFQEFSQAVRDRGGKLAIVKKQGQEEEPLKGKGLNVCQTVAMARRSFEPLQSPA